MTTVVISEHEVAVNYVPPPINLSNPNLSQQIARQQLREHGTIVPQQDRILQTPTEQASDPRLTSHRQMTPNQQDIVLQTPTEQASDPRLKHQQQ